MHDIFAVCFIVERIEKYVHLFISVAESAVILVGCVM